MNNHVVEFAALRSSSKAKAALIVMEKELDNARTYEDIRRIERSAEVLKLLYAEVEEVRRQAEQTIVMASARVGEELRVQPVATGAEHGGRSKIDGTARVLSNPPAPTLAQQVGSKNRGLRLKGLAAAGRDAVKRAIQQLHQAGKDATVSSVLKVLGGDDKKSRRADREVSLAAATIAASKTLNQNLYGVILADPPWRFEPYSRNTGMDRAAENHYPTEGIEAIKAMRVPAADDCVLFLWATIPMLPQALDVMEAWGFRYKSQFVWVKDKIGLGFWVREKHELLLIGTRGNVPAPAPGDQYESAQIARRGEHSEKPFLFHEVIEDYFPNLPRLEMFARGEPITGWDRWGNEAAAAE